MSVGILVMTKTASAEDVNQLWMEFKKTRSEAIRQKLGTHYVYLVKSVVERIIGTLPRHIEKEDLINEGIVGLMESIDRFDPNRGIKFDTYGYTRVRGAVYDYLRSMDWVPRSLRTKSKETERSINALEKRLGRKASDLEVAEEMNVTVGELSKLLSEVASAVHLSLDEGFQSSDGEEPLTLMDRLEDTQADSGEANLVAEALLANMAQAMEELPQNEQYVLGLYYQESMTLKEIGAVLGVTESRVSQLHTKAIMRLRSRLREFLTKK